MEHVKYVCQKCLYEQKEPGICPKCKESLVASCPVCGNPMVGEHVHLEEVYQALLYGDGDKLTTGDYTDKQIDFNYLLFPFFCIIEDRLRISWQVRYN